jgi:hypothetical protein
LILTDSTISISLQELYTKKTAIKAIEITIKAIIEITIEAAMEAVYKNIL